MEQREVVEQIMSDPQYIDGVIRRRSGACRPVGWTRAGDLMERFERGVLWMHLTRSAR